MFLWFRMRGVHRDFISQNYRSRGRNDAWAIEVHERIVRTHILLNYECTGAPGFSENQNIVQTNAYLKTLNELYDDARERSVPGVAVLESPNVRARAGALRRRRVPRSVSRGCPCVLHGCLHRVRLPARRRRGAALVCRRRSSGRTTCCCRS